MYVCIYIYIYILKTRLLFLKELYFGFFQTFEYIHLYIYTSIYIPALFMYRYFYYAHLFLENSSILSLYFFTEIFGITWAII